MAPVDPLGRDAEPAGVQPLQRGADLLGGPALGEQALPLPRRRPAVNGVGLTRTSCPGPVSSRTVSAQPQRLGLEPGDDRAGGHRLGGEQVRRPDQDADPDPPRGQRRRPARRPPRPIGRRGCPRRTAGGPRPAPHPDPIASRITSTACSQRTKLDRGPTCPPHSRPSSTNRRAPVVAGTAAAAPARGRADRWRSPAVPARAAWSGRPPAISANGGRASAIASSCSRRSSGGTNPRMPTPQGRPAEPFGRLVEQRADVVPAHQGERQEGKRPAVGNRLGERDRCR